MESFLEDIFMVENILNFELKSMIIYFHFSGLFSKIFPTGNAESFCNHIFRLFDSDGNNFLDFKEFLMALDIAQCTDERQKLEWSFRSLDNVLSKYHHVSTAHLFPILNVRNMYLMILFPVSSRMWDVDDSGCINLNEMTNIIATMDDVEGVEQEAKVMARVIDI